jgi:hypothetical protein
MKTHICAAMILSASGIAHAQEATPATTSVQQPPTPLLVTPQVQQKTAVLPANTELTLSMNDTITTKGKRWNEGDTFDMTVTHDVLLGQYVIIPKGARGVGRITWLTNKGAFGKSGKVEIDIEYIEVGGRRIPVSGHYRQEGEGNTRGVFAGFVTGKSGVIPAGRELVARTKSDLPVAFAGPPPSTAPAPLVVGATATATTPAAIGAELGSPSATGPSEPSKP